MTKTFTFNGTSSSAYQLGIRVATAYDAPEYDYQAISVPGRNGDIIIPNGKYKNKPIVYEAWLYNCFRQMRDGVANWLCSPKGYVRLTDDYNPGYYRLAMFTGGLNWEVSQGLDSARTTLTFDCKPQRFLISGEAEQTLSATGGTLENPANYEALPLIKLTPARRSENDIVIRWHPVGASLISTLTLTGQAQAPANSTIYLDCETQQAYRVATIGGTTYINHLTTGYFPKLAGGANTILSVTGAASVKITPRWWTL